MNPQAALAQQTKTEEARSTAAQSEHSHGVKQRAAQEHLAQAQFKAGRSLVEEVKDTKAAIPIAIRLACDKDTRFIHSLVAGREKEWDPYAAEGEAHFYRPEFRDPAKIIAAALQIAAEQPEIAEALKRERPLSEVKVSLTLGMGPKDSLEDMLVASYGLKTEVGRWNSYYLVEMKTPLSEEKSALLSKEVNALEDQIRASYETKIKLSENADERKRLAQTRELSIQQAYGTVISQNPKMWGTSGNLSIPVPFPMVAEQVRRMTQEK